MVTLWRTDTRGGGRSDIFLFQLLFPIILGGLVHEKEFKLREIMKMMVRGLVVPTHTQVVHTHTLTLGLWHGTGAENVGVLDGDVPVQPGAVPVCNDAVPAHRHLAGVCVLHQERLRRRLLAYVPVRVLPCCCEGGGRCVVGDSPGVVAGTATP